MMNGLNGSIPFVSSWHFQIPVASRPTRPPSMRLLPEQLKLERR